MPDAPLRRRFVRFQGKIKRAQEALAQKGLVHMGQKQFVKGPHRAQHVTRFILRGCYSTIASKQSTSCGSFIYRVPLLDVIIK